MLVLAVIVISPSISKANEITISQIGDDLLMDIEQDGNDHAIKKKTTASKIDGDRVAFIARQTKNDNIVEYDQLVGDDNVFGFWQGENIYGWEASGSHGNNNYIDINVEGNNNEIGHQQLHNYHEVKTDIDGDGNDVWTNQQNYGAKSIDLTIKNDNNNVDIDQRNGNTATSHTATIVLDGTYSTDLTLNQTGWAANSYTLNQYCTNSAGCAVSVTQN